MGGGNRAVLARVAYFFRSIADANAVGAVSDLELYVLQWNIAHFRRLLSTETDEGIRSRIAALLDDTQRKLKATLAARRSKSASNDSADGRRAPSETGKASSFQR